MNQEIIKSRSIADDLKRIITRMKYDKLFVLTDENTSRFCLSFLGNIEISEQFVLQAGDSNKCIESLIGIWRKLSDGGFTRHSLMINLGGGMVSDIGGFAAATFKRGIRYINIPTTVLGAVDAAVGGKTGINFCGLKNEIGSFYPAICVIISSDFFKTLDKIQILSGFAEMIKHSLIHSQTDWVKLLLFDADNIDYADLTETLFRSVSIKRHIAEKDPFEKDIRKALNLGHTVGHALECFAMERERPVPHGYAVAWGLIAELYLSNRICGFPKEKLLKTVRFIQSNYGAMDISCDDYERLYEIMKHDKKNIGDKIIFTLLSEIGNIKLDENASKDLIFESLDFYRDSVGL